MLGMKTCELAEIELPRCVITKKDVEYHFKSATRSLRRLDLCSI